jgi:hypothetical protein
VLMLGSLRSWNKGMLAVIMLGLGMVVFTVFFCSNLSGYCVISSHKISIRNSSVIVCLIVSLLKYVHHAAKSALIIYSVRSCAHLLAPS